MRLVIVPSASIIYAQSLNSLYLTFRTPTYVPITSTDVSVIIARVIKTCTRKHHQLHFMVPVDSILTCAVEFRQLCYGTVSQSTYSHSKCIQPLKVQSLKLHSSSPIQSHRPQSPSHFHTRSSNPFQTLYPPSQYRSSQAYLADDW